jgi:hypothetical protein
MIIIWANMTSMPLKLALGWLLGVGCVLAVAWLFALPWFMPGMLLPQAASVAVAARPAQATAARRVAV